MKNTLTRHWINAGIHSSLDEDERRKVFLTNTLSIFLGGVMVVLALNDFLNTQNYLAGYRRIAVLLCMLLIPLLNQKRFYKLSKSLFLTVPSIMLLGVPILIGDFFLGQFIWFQYVLAVFCSVPFILFDHSKEKIFIAVFFIYYLIGTLFIDKLLLAYSTPPEALLELVTNFTDFKLPPLFVALFSTATLLWYNRTNVQYETKLKLAHKQLEEAHVQMMEVNKEYGHINKNLEFLVDKRSKELESKNLQIIEYANINAHKVRGPLARIMGLINIINYTKEPSETSQILQKLEISAEELNYIITEINKTLEEKK